MSDYDSIEGLQKQGLIDSKKVAIIKILLVSLCHGAMIVMIGPQIFSIWLDKQVHLDSLQIGELLGMKGIVCFL